MKNFLRQNEVNHKCYVDIDWASFINDNKNIFGYVFFLSSSALSWNSNKYEVVAQSTTEAQFILAAGTAATGQVLWFKNFLST